MANTLNTDIVYPLSGQTVFFRSADSSSYTVTNEAGIVYLSGIFSSSAETAIISLNGVPVTFTGSLYMATINTEGGNVVANNYTVKYPTNPSCIVNLLDTTSKVKPFFTIATTQATSTSTSMTDTIASPCSPSDRNKGPYLPVKKGDVFSYSASSTADVILSFLFFK